MKTADFLARANEALAELKRKYHLAEWWLYVEVVKPEELDDPAHAAEAAMQVEYRVATLRFSSATVQRADWELLATMLEHEVQHVATYPVERLRLMVLDALEEDSAHAAVIAREFGRVMEELRSLLGRLTGAGNNWELPRPQPQPQKGAKSKHGAVELGTYPHRRSDRLAGGA